MSSGFPSGVPDLYSASRRAVAVASNADGEYNPFSCQQQRFPFRSAVAAMEQDAAGQIRRGELMGKRSLVEFQQNQKAIGFYLRNVKMKTDYHNDFSPYFSSPRYGFPVLNGSFDVAGTQSRVLGCGQSFGVPGGDSAERSLMDHRLKELEKELLNDDDDNDDAVSVVTKSEWSEAIRDLIGPAQKFISPSPTSSSSSCSTSVSQPPPCNKQAVIDAAVAFSEGNPGSAAEILTRLLQDANARGTCQQKLTAYMVFALRLQMGDVPAVGEVQSEEQSVATQILYRVSPCFKLGFMAANLAILEATSELAREKIHVLEFEIGHEGQYVNLLHTLAANAKAQSNSAPSLSITAFPNADVGVEKLRVVGQSLKALALRTGVSMCFRIRDCDIDNLNREKLEIQSDEALAVNFAFKLHKLPDESVTVENPRDELLRRVKALSPAVVTVAEQELNTNTAPFVTRVRDVYDYYAALLESLDSTVSGDSPDRARIDQGIRSRITNSIACEGRERVERCEVFGKWRARMGMAGFRPLVLDTRAADTLRGKMNSGTRVNPGFTLSEEAGGLCFDWKGKTLTFVSSWR